MTNLRVGGLATGMDLESIVQNLMKVEQFKLDRLEQQKTRIQWQQEAYNNISKFFANFIIDTQKAFGLAKAGSTGLIKQSVSSFSWVKSAASSDESVLTARARTNAAAGTYTIEVEQLATNWSAASAGEVDELLELNLEENETIEFIITTKVNGEERQVKFSTAKDSGADVIITSSEDGKVKMSDVAKAINEAKIGITAQFSITDVEGSKGRFFIQTNNTGDANTIKITDNSGVFLGSTNLHYIKTDEQGKPKLDENGKVITEAVASNHEYKGHDAVIHFGAARELKFSSNQFTINDIDFTAKETGTVTVTVDTDVESVYQKIVEFVDKYNEMIDKINDLLTEKVYRDYQPLTAEQREAMSEKEIELWEEKAKSGLLNRDMYLTRIAQQIRSGIYQPAGEGQKGLLISNFGITTERYVAGSMGGKLVIDEYKLKEAIKNDVDSVLELFFAQPDSSVTDETEKRNQTGIVGRIYNDLIDGMKQIIHKAGYGDDAALYRSVDSRMLLDFVTEFGSISYLQRDISKLNDRISVFQAQMLRKENQYWAQFTALEKAINQMNAQAAWLAQQFGG